jgi:sugar lactone lactonase YvrE
MLPHLPARLGALPGLLLAVLAPALAGAQPPAPLGDFDGHGDVGAPRRPGAATYDVKRHEYVIAAGGANMWGGRDEMHLVWKRLTGDFVLTARARLLGRGGAPHRKLGWTARASLAPDAPHVTAAVHGDGLAALQFRRAAGAETEERRAPVAAPDVVQLERRGGVWLMSVARSGDTLTTERVTDVPLGDTVYVGLFVCAHDSAAVERGTFGNVRITIPARPGLVPYREYLGAVLEVMDVASGDRTVLHRSPEPLQAPNWTRDGRALVYNERGRMYRFDLATRTPSVIETGFADNNNNDHVLSFDGRTLGISHGPRDEGGRSAVYTVPLAGGTPRRVTPPGLGPSYLHGWSPDGRFLVYTAQRDSEFDVYRIPAAGGAEVRLTTTRGLDDGPEYSPDGRWIYFNSVRSGTMQLWRMRPDGSAPEQLTRDGFNNWFPHVSPDGKWVVFISFLPDVSPSDHPWYKHVYLRLMPAGGGAPRVIAYVYGGQGTINVPSWSPDSRRIAFVSNTGMPR